MDVQNKQRCLWTANLRTVFETMSVLDNKNDKHDRLKSDVLIISEKDTVGQGG